MADLIYTYIGQVLISVNPFCDTGVYGPEYINKHRGKKRIELPPHIYAIAEDAYYHVKSYQEKQCVIISGESGAGKTGASFFFFFFLLLFLARQPVFPPPIPVPQQQHRFVPFLHFSPLNGRGRQEDYGVHCGGVWQQRRRAAGQGDHHEGLPPLFCVAD